MASEVDLLQGGEVVEEVEGSSRTLIVAPEEDVRLVGPSSQRRGQLLPVCDGGRSRGGG